MNPDSERKLDPRSLVGVVLIGLGALFLLGTFGIFRLVASMVVAMAFLAGAATFAMVFLNNRRHWWAIFPAFMLGFIGLNIGFRWLLPYVGGSGTLFLGGLGLSFLAVYAVERTHWWPLIPGGALLSLALVTASHWLLPGIAGGALLFFGLAFTFATVYQLAGARRQDSWALIVAAACGGIGLLALGGMIIRLMFPVLLVAAGLYLLLRMPRNQ
jgi:hypothetical protein